MSRSESRLDADSPVAAMAREAAGAIGQAIVRNPLAVGGATAFIVAMSYICGNALWNQAQPHNSAFFITRELAHHARGETSGEQGEAVVRPAADPVVLQVQDLLADMSLYTGSIDGISGPQTRKAVEDYQRLSGLEVSGRIDGRLLDDLKAQNAPARTAPPAPQPRPSPEKVAAVEPVAFTTADIERVQAGLRAFGRGDIEIDGVIGSRTKGAIREFQGLFGLPVTGEPDAPLMAKMREIGLTN